MLIITLASDTFKGLLSITLSALGYTVLTTDIEPAISQVLLPNVQAWIEKSHQWAGSLCVCKLDWTQPIDQRITHSTLQSGLVKEGVVNLNRLEGSSQSDDHTTNTHLDLIVTTDTVYAPELIDPLLKTLDELSSGSSRPPLIYLALERRDPGVIESFLKKSQEFMNFKTNRIDHQVLVKLTTQMGWELDDWEGVEIYKLRRRFQGSSSLRNRKNMGDEDQELLGKSGI